MIRITTRAAMCALSICAAPLAFAADNAAEPPPITVGDVTRAEMRHFAIFTRYRAMTDSSGDSGQGSTKSAAGAQGKSEVVSGANVLSGSGPIVDQYACRADSQGK